MSTILITGGAGFLGAHLTHRFVLEGHNVIIVDNLNTIGGIPFVHPHATFYENDICDRALYNNLKKHPIDTIFHLAAQSAGESSYDNPSYDILTNSYGTYQIAKFAKEHRVRRFIYSSTVAVYGDNAKGSTAENVEIAPDSIYGVSKYSGELFVKQLLKNTTIQYTIFRIFNAYGPGENLNYLKKGMVSIYASYIWRGIPIEVKGSLERYRDFTYIEDCIDILQMSLDATNSFGKTYNLSSGKKTIIKDLIACMLIASKQPSDYPIKVYDKTPGDSFGFHAAIDALCKDFNWSPKIQLEDGLQRYFEWIFSIPVTDNLHLYHPLAKKYL